MRKKPPRNKLPYTKFHDNYHTIMTIYDNFVYVNADAPGMLFGKS